MSDTPLVSVIVPVWNGARFLAQALASIRAQNYAPLELWVLDDGSTDATPEIATRLEFDALYVPLPHRGLVPTRREGIARARGEFLAFLDSDDVWSASKLQIQLGLLQTHPDIQIVNGYTQLVRLTRENGEGTSYEDWGEPVIAPSFGSALFRRTSFNALGPLDEADWRIDIDWLSRARERAVPVLMHSDVVQYYRRHESNMTNDRARGKQELLLMLKDSLARRQAIGQQGKSLPPVQIPGGTKTLKKDEV